ncbi:MAG: CaiB/BaiF CoA transferase family protein [Tepidiformaceae bacterium]
MSETTGNPPLTGIRVIDISTERAELAGRLLADLGAEVIKVEPPEGAASRHLPPWENGKEGSADGSLYWAAFGLGKKSVVIDIKSTPGREQLKGLLKTADAVIESFDPGVMSGLGLGYEHMKVLNPALIYASVTPYGQTGPDAHSPATDLIAEAAGGLVGLQGDGDRPPIPIGFPQASLHAGAQAAADIIVALNERANSGLGQHLDTSMQAAMVWTLMQATGFPKNTGGDPPGTGENRAFVPPQTIPGVNLPILWKASDGWLVGSITIGTLGGLTAQNMAIWMEEEGFLDPRIKGVDFRAYMVDAVEGRLEPALVGILIDQIIAFFQTKTKLEVLDRALRDSLLFAPVFNVEDLLRDPHMQDRKFWVEIGGKLHPGAYAKLSRTPIEPKNAAPKLGGHQSLLTSSHTPVAPAPSATPRKRVFEGLKVADFAWVGVGPIISKALADHGATVVRVESNNRPDVLRTAPPFKNNEVGLDNAQFFANFNSSKLSLAIDLSVDEGRKVAHKLIDWADVVVESFTPGTLAKLGLSYEHISPGRPDLIMLSTCLRGQTGPHRAFGGYGNQGAALSGLHSITGWPDRGPTGPWGAYTDFINPRIGVALVASALFEKRTSGLGQHIDLSQGEAGIHFLEPLVLDYTVNGKLNEGRGHESWYASPHGTYRVDGKERYVAIACATPGQWQALKSVAPLSAFDDPTLDRLDARLTRDSEIDAALSAWLADKEAFAVVAELKAAGVPAAVVQRPSDLYEDAQLAHRGFFVMCDHTKMGPTPYDGLVTIFSETPGIVTAAPCLGEHTEYVMRELLGVGEEEMVEYLVAGALT